MTGYTGSVWIDGEPVLVGVPLQPDLNVQDRPEIFLARGESIPVELWVDDVEVRFLDASLPLKDKTGVTFRPLFRDNFNRYEGALFPRQGGWAPGAVEVKAEEKLRREAAGVIMKPLRTAQSGEEAEGPVIDDRVYASSSKSFKLEASGEEPARATKRFSLPVRVPYDVSAETFSIIPAGEAAQTVEGAAPTEDRNDRDKRQKRWDGGGTSGSQRRVDKKDPGGTRPAAVRRASRSDGKSAKTMSGAPATGTFYIYAFDGRLLAEYDVNGQLVREYIYFAGMLVAEYRNQESRLLYYASDQTNSTRIVTDNIGNVVYSAAHEPYGGIQKTWVSSYDPSLKFSGKERDAESDLDYFGARYYDPSIYRFLNVDPITSGREALSNPQRWNRYAYCLSNPVNYVDQGGASPIKIEIIRKVWDMNSGTCYGEIWVNGEKWGDTIENLRRRMVPTGSYQGTLKYVPNVYNNNYPYIELNTIVCQIQWNDKEGWLQVYPYIPSIMAGDNVRNLDSCFYVSASVMRELEAAICFYQQEASRCYQYLMNSQQQSLEGGGLDIVLSSLDAIDYLSIMCWSLQDLLVYGNVRNLA